MTEKIKLTDKNIKRDVITVFHKFGKLEENLMY